MRRDALDYAVLFRGTERSTPMNSASSTAAPQLDRVDTLQRGDLRGARAFRPDAIVKVKATVAAPQISQAESAISAWADAQVAPWSEQEPLDPRSNARLLDLARGKASIFLYDFRGETVYLRDVAPYGDMVRANLYLRHFQQVVKGMGRRYWFTLAIDVDDYPIRDADVPVFSFQKHAGDKLLLLPDVDILSAHYFIDDRFEDSIPFAKKTQEAVFVGSTTGAVITQEIVENLELPRLRSAVYFKGSPTVHFTLPDSAIVQCEGPETVSMIQNLGVGGPAMSWQEQYRYRYLISMDGNGATCSRVLLALRSNSILVKYRSDSVLYYFNGLEKGVNYLEVSEDVQVDFIIENLNDHAGEQIATASKVFAQTYLSRPGVFVYTAALLDRYGDLVGVEDDSSSPCDPVPDLVIDSYGHVSGVGETSSEPGSWLGDPKGHQVIEGFSLVPGPGVDLSEVSYQGLNADGSLTEAACAHAFCGTRRNSTPLCGLKVQLSGTAAKLWSLGYEAVFNGGARSPVVSGGELCRSPEGGALSAFRLVLKRR